MQTIKKKKKKKKKRGNSVLRSLVVVFLLKKKRLDEVCFLNIFHGEVTYLPSSPVQVH
jgi:hypothetical protein